MSSSRRRSSIIRNSNDIVTLNVGGTHFTTCTSTLITYSSYFDAMFSQKWTTELEDDDGDQSSNDNNGLLGAPKEIVFIDKDPTPFQYILNYMREGYINLPKNDYFLAKNIILQAQYFGIESFLSKIKSKSVENCMKSGCDTKIFNVDEIAMMDEAEISGQSEQENEQIDEEMRLYQCYVKAFDQRYETLFDAFDDGCLPYTYFEKYRDQICIQLGDGSTITVNKTKAMEKSEVLSKMIESGPTFMSSQDVLFIDQDPEVFKYILDYIRYAQLNLPDHDPALFRRILHCAEELGFKDYVIMVKARTMAGLEFSDAPMGADPMFLDDSLHATVSSISNSQRENALLFDQRFHSIDAAFTEGILPKMFFNLLHIAPR